eukprot:1132684-Rhodomonas_salina.2
MKGEAAQEDDTTPDGLAYNVNTFELEVERFLEVESWNHQHGFEATDQVEEEAVEEMKARQVRSRLHSSLLFSLASSPPLTTSLSHAQRYSLLLLLSISGSDAHRCVSGDVQAAGDDRRTKIKESFKDEDQKLDEMDKGIKNLAQRLEKVAEDAERASREEVEAG